MYKYLLQNETYMAWGGILPLVAFFLMFGIILVQTWRMDSRETQEYGRMPLQDSEEENPFIQS